MNTVYISFNHLEAPVNITEAKHTHCTTMHAQINKRDLEREGERENGGVALAFRNDGRLSNRIRTSRQRPRQVTGEGGGGGRGRGRGNEAR